MPRRSKRLTGTGSQKSQRTDLAQPAAAPTNMAYGAHKETITAQKAIPLPATAPPVPAPPVPSGPGPATGPPQGGGFAAALAAAQGMSAVSGGLTGPTMRPGEPVTAGLPSGAGPGPEVLATHEPGVADVYRRLAIATGDPDMALLADLAAGYGL